MTRKKTILWTLSVVILALATAIFIFTNTTKAPAPDKLQTVKSEEKPADITAPKPNFDINRHSIDDPHGPWVIVNKKRPLPIGYTPNLVNVTGGMLQKDAAQELSILLADARTNGVPMSVLSSYRSYETQRRVYEGYVSKDGQAAADTYSARPGYSEHQTGLAVDLGNGQCNLEACFANTPAGKWLTSNAHNYGYIIRYLEHKTPVTGYQYEPWHVRYVGKELAAELFKSNQTMEEYFKLPAAPSY